LFFELKFFFKVGFRRPTHANNNLIAIIPTDGEGEPQKNDLPSNNFSNCPISKLSDTTDDNKPAAVQNENNEGNCRNFFRMYVFNFTINKYNVSLHFCPKNDLIFLLSSKNCF